MDHFFRGMWGSHGTGDGQFEAPFDIGVDSNDDIYVTDRDLHRVQKFTRTGDFIRKWGEFGIGGGSRFRDPHGIACFPGNSLLVADYGNLRIQEFSDDGVFITEWDGSGIPGNRFNLPIGVAINKTNGMHYISERGGDRVQRFHWDPGVVGPFPDEILEELERLSINEKKTMTEIVILALTDYLKKRDKKDIKLSS
jgi:DNA-binding beta-propeller fold protein YncE